MTIPRKTGHVSYNLRQRLRTSLSKIVCFPVGISAPVSARVKSGGLLLVRSCLRVLPGRYLELTRSYVMCFPVGRRDAHTPMCTSHGAPYGVFPGRIALF